MVVGIAGASFGHTVHRGYVSYYTKGSTRMHGYRLLGYPLFPCEFNYDPTSTVEECKSGIGVISVPWCLRSEDCIAPCEYVCACERFCFWRIVMVSGGGILRGYSVIHMSMHGFRRVSDSCMCNRIRGRVRNVRNGLYCSVHLLNARVFVIISYSGIGGR